MTTYHAKYSDSSLWSHIKKYADVAGIKTIYMVLILHQVLKNKNTPEKSKELITGVLGYFISPTDVIHDATPEVGFFDDLVILNGALNSISTHITKDILFEAKKKLKELFPNMKEEEIMEIDAKL